MKDAKTRYSLQEEEQHEFMGHERIIVIVCADSNLTRRYFGELEQSGANYRLLLAVSPAEAQRTFQRLTPDVILLDVSAHTGSVQTGSGQTTQTGGAQRSLESAVSTLIEGAPVVVVAAPQQQCALAFLIASGAVDFVARDGNFVSVAAGLIERRIRLASRGMSMFHEGQPTEEFGEMLRHEVNNPLTGILGNAELLLARRDPLPAAAIARVQTIAALAVRLRETVRRLSQACGAERSMQRASVPEGQRASARPRLRVKSLALARGTGGPVAVPSSIASHEPVEE